MTEQTAAGPEAPPPLESNERLDQPTFHERYEAMGPGVRAELIAGRVCMPSPTTADHAISHDETGYWLTTYRLATAGTQTANAPTCKMGVTFEPQPDHTLFVREDHGGACRRRGRYFTGPPDLVAEVALSTESIDLHEKREEYERHGVSEYVVVALRQQRVYWFTRVEDALVELTPGEDGVLRSAAFPGLWLDPAAIVAEDLPRVLEVLRGGLATPEHAAFVAELARRRAALTPP
ncbi:MAG: Uma2 family endonuclease [Gemmataceae bacterium]